MTQSGYAIGRAEAATATWSRGTVRRKATGVILAGIVLANAAILKAEALRAQSANVQLVSAASDSSEAFAQSLQSGILKARHA